MLVELVPSFQNVKITTFCLDLFKSKKFDVWFHFHGNRHTWKSRWWDCCRHSCTKENGTKSALFLLLVPSPPQRSLLRFQKNWRTSNKTKKAHGGWWEGVYKVDWRPHPTRPHFFIPSLQSPSTKSGINPLRSGELQVHYLCYSK